MTSYIRGHKHICAPRSVLLVLFILSLLLCDPFFCVTFSCEVFIIGKSNAVKAYISEMPDLQKSSVLNHYENMPIQIY